MLQTRTIRGSGAPKLDPGRADTNIFQPIDVPRRRAQKLIDAIRSKQSGPSTGRCGQSHPCIAGTAANSDKGGVQTAAGTASSETRKRFRRRGAAVHPQQIHRGWRRHTSTKATGMAAPSLVRSSQQGQTCDARYQKRRQQDHVGFHPPEAQVHHSSGQRRQKPDPKRHTASRG